MHIAKCPLCLQEKPLIMSHMMPSAIYDYTRGPSGHHISMTPDLVIETDREVQARLLCRECDNDLNNYGESWLLPLLARIDTDGLLGQGQGQGSISLLQTDHA